MELVELKAESRVATGKNKVNKIRAAGKVPVNLYGHNTEPASLTVDTREFETVMRSHTGSSFIMKLKVDGGAESSVIIKEIQRHPTKDNLLHIDLLSVALDETIVTGVPIHVIGDAIGVREGGVIQHGVRELQIEALPTDLPEFIEIDISELNIGSSLHANEIALPARVTLVGSEEDLVVGVVVPAKVEEAVLVAEEGEAPEEGAEAAEGEEAAEAADKS